MKSRTCSASYPPPPASTDGCEQGFTLIELSIVLVIIGLVIGGILAGQDLIHAAHLRAVVNQERQFVVAVNTFQTKYNCLPGDCINATDFFGTLSSCYNERNTYGTTQTCNGNGNGFVENNQATTQQYFEQWRFWQHLGNAGLIPGSYKGGTATSNAPVTTTANEIPTSVMNSNYGWQVGNLNDYCGTYVPANIGNTLYLQQSGGQVFFAGSGMLPKDMYNIDLKIDDGLPATGKVVTNNYALWYSPKCFTGTAPNTIYNLSSTDTTCDFIFANAF